MTDAHERAKELYEEQFGKIAPELLGVNESLMRTLGIYARFASQVEAETLQACHTELHRGMMCSCCLRVSDWCEERLRGRQQAQRAKEGES